MESLLILIAIVLVLKLFYDFTVGFWLEFNWMAGFVAGEAQRELDKQRKDGAYETQIIL